MNTTCHENKSHMCQYFNGSGFHLKFCSVNLIFFFNFKNSCNNKLPSIWSTCWEHNFLFWAFVAGYWFDCNCCLKIIAVEMAHWEIILVYEVFRSILFPLFHRIYFLLNTVIFRKFCFHMINKAVLYFSIR